MADSLFVQEGNIFTPTPLAHGPWSVDQLHGGSTGGLLAYVLEQYAPNPEMRLVRTTLDMFRPVPLSALRVDTAVLREGRRIQVIEATLFSEDKKVARSVGVRMKTTDVDVPTQYQPESAPPRGPEGIEGITFPSEEENHKRLAGLNANIDIRRLSGFDGKGEGCSWFKITLPVIEGIKNSPFVNLGVFSDFGNGLAQIFLPGKMGMINSDITLYLHRDPVGDWIALKSKMVMNNTGVGVVNGDFYDQQGLIAQSHQAVLVQNP